MLPSSPLWSLNVFGQIFCGQKKFLSIHLHSFCVHQKKVNYYFETKYGVYHLFSPSCLYLLYSYYIPYCFHRLDIRANVSGQCCEAVIFHCCCFGKITTCWICAIRWSQTDQWGIFNKVIFTMTLSVHDKFCISPNSIWWIREIYQVWVYMLMTHFLTRQVLRMFPDFPPFGFCPSWPPNHPHTLIFFIALSPLHQ